MTRTTTLLGIIAIALASILTALPANAQRVFVSGSGLDTNPCTFPQPCRTFQQAFNTVAAGGEIDVLDPAGYGPLNINKSISVQAHGFGGITNASTNAITIAAGSSDVITLNGLLLDGAGTGNDGIEITAAGSVQILDCVIRHFTSGVVYVPTNSSTNLLLSGTVASDNAEDGIQIGPHVGVVATIMVSQTTANDNHSGVVINNGIVMIDHGTLSNNGVNGLFMTGGTLWLSSSSISGNGTGANVTGGTATSYVDNDINGNSTMDVSGTLGTTMPR